MVFTRMNDFSFWLLPPGSFFAAGGANAAGWTMYPPLSIQMGPAWT
jgi:cytochrome c oxidase subunit 1